MFNHTNLAQLIIQYIPGLQPNYAILFLFFAIFASLVILANLTAIVANLMLQLILWSSQTLPNLRQQISRRPTWRPTAWWQSTASLLSQNLFQG